MPCLDLPTLNVFKNFRGIFPDVSTKRQKISADSIDSSSNIDLPLIEQSVKEYKMRETHLCTHSVMSHGGTVTRTHMHDWLILLLLLAIASILHVIHPFHRFVGQDMMTDLKYPLKSNTVPVWAVPIYSILWPMVIFIIVYFYRRDIYDLHHAILGLLYSVLLTNVITEAIKNAVGRPRPDFFWRCFPDGKDVYDQWGNVICHGDSNVIREGHKSFPSGHTSMSFAGLGFLSLFLAGKIKAFNRKGHIAKLCVVFLPLLVASLVGISRVDDYWHHWQDVFAGGLLGLVVATFCYLQFFPPPYHHQGCRTYAYLRVMEEEERQATNATNTLVAESQATEHSVIEVGSNGCIATHLASNSDSKSEDIEFGRQ